MASDISLRLATEQDIPTILAFIQGLAEYEKLSDQVVATEEKLKQTLFGSRAYAEVVIAEYQHQPAGFALFFHNFSTFLAKPGIYLEDLFVLPQYRGHGLGKLLLTYLAKLAVERDCGRLEWSVLDWNQPAIDFYQSQGATMLHDWRINRVTGSALTKLAQHFGQNE
ncbi:GNAT family N-acetyltransferase [Rheinheimera maricola]|uniref:GNAT family N-acetyltransferase n=1 Tax=Rheinheimera maricola TaxID=2793282 RepID=A0ABS7XAE4_9GAMM|nr:GNAT family N-acetyltransferase [Rheinheimera maricola]MBZ9611757.1 GNAT family N-acetyltransferase [Rheinheimera maricola]